MNKKHPQRYVVCVHSAAGEDLQPRKIYRVLPDESAAKEGFIRVVDESGEDYLYPLKFFLPIELPQKLERAISVAS